MTTTETKHSPTPWERATPTSPRILDRDGMPVARVSTRNIDDPRSAAADAQIITRAVNAHDDLVAALREIITAESAGDAYDIARDALRKAGVTDV